MTKEKMKKRKDEKNIKLKRNSKDEKAKTKHNKIVNHIII